MNNKLIAIRLILFPVLLFTINLFPQNLNDSLAVSFIEALIKNSKELRNFVNPEELKLSERLGISYTETENKFLISNDLDPSLRKSLEEKIVRYKFSIKNLSKDFSILKIETHGKNITREYLFYKSKLISKPFYYSKDWQNKESIFFNFHISKPEQFNNYSINKLDSFVYETTRILELSDEKIEKLKKEKIHYFICGDENEIELLTGYKARGLFFIPYDYIISTFNCHYHEILHLLINYKLQEVNLYTLPFLQEGFAVGFGGRGGKEPDVILGMGKFLAQNNFMDYKLLLDKSGFNNFDASLAYPVSGLYIKFLIDTFGINKFLNLYKKYSGSFNKINKIKIDDSDLSQEEDWYKYLNNFIPDGINVSGFNENDFQKKVTETRDYLIYENNNEYLFKIKNTIGIKPEDHLDNYMSKLFNDLFLDKSYQSQKYLISANDDEVSVYNLYSNNLVAKYVKGFSVNNESVTKKQGYYIFTLKKKVFDESINNYIYSEIKN